MGCAGGGGSRAHGVEVSSRGGGGRGRRGRGARHTSGRGAEEPGRHAGSASPGGGWTRDSIRERTGGPSRRGKRHVVARPARRSASRGQKIELVDGGFRRVADVRPPRPRDPAAG